MQTNLEILLINKKEGTSKKTGSAYSISEAHCVLRDDKGAPGGVGVLTVPKALEGVAAVGTFRATFGLEAPTFGENAGKVVAVLTGLEPVTARQPQPAKVG